ncbi:MAG: DnaD domain protein [Hungatella sp.]|jgi:DnaD/phage-associated family protein|nr:DnaD domain protein [Hungatella sp.]
MKSCLKLNGTMVANEFIDKYMAGANGEYVKVYLYILRHEGQIRDMGQIADDLNHTEADVKRAVGYWARLGVLEEQGSVNGQAEIKSGTYPGAEGAVSASGFGGTMEQGRESGEPGRAEAPGNAGRFNPGVPGGAAGGFNRPEASESSGGNARNGFEKAGGKGAGAKSGAAGGSDVPVPERREAAFPKGGGEPSSSPRKLYTPEQVSRLADQEDFTQLLYISQKYMDKIFTPRECEVFAYLYDALHMSVELLEYLVEYCVQNGHSSIRYLESVAINWHEKGFRTVEEAKGYTSTFSKEGFAVMRAFGISDRRPGDAEQEMIRRWFRDYGFTKDIVLEACSRTLKAIHKPSFPYADKILSDWKKGGVRVLADVQRMDRQRDGKRGAKPGDVVKPSKNQFHNFEQRDTDYDAMVLERLKERLGDS